MKRLFYFLSGIVSLNATFASDINWKAETDDFEFDTVVISRIQGNTYEPLINVDGKYTYVGFNSSVPGYFEYGVFPDISRGTVLVEDSGAIEGAGYYFVMELMAGGEVIAYSDYTSFDDIKGYLSTTRLTWKPENFTSTVPEPSSGLLLLMGGALLGLRRKRRVA